MPTPRNHKLMGRSEPGGVDGAASKKLPARSATSVSETLPRTTQSKVKGIAGVPTHAVRPPEERRVYARANLSLPLRLTRVAGQKERKAQALRTANISSSGVLFLCPRLIKPGTTIEIEVRLVDRPLGRGTVKMLTSAHVVRTEPASRAGWHALAASFDEITFQREEPLPQRFQRH